MIRKSDKTSAVADTEETMNAPPEAGAEDKADAVAEQGADPAEVSAAQDGKKPTSKAKRVTGIVFLSLGLAVVAFLFTVAVTLAVDKFVKKKPVPAFCGISTLIVQTGSMSGTIDEGDLIIVKRRDDYRVGDIITFMPEYASVPTTHRIVRIQDGKFYTKGDANNAEDTRPITKDNIVGKVVGTVPHVGLFFRWIKDDFGWAYIVAVAAVVVSGVILYKVFAAKKEN